MKAVTQALKILGIKTMTDFRKAYSHITRQEQDKLISTLIKEGIIDLSACQHPWEVEGELEDGYKQLVGGYLYYITIIED